jgi:hypothetical protein
VYILYQRATAPVIIYIFLFRNLKGRDSLGELGIYGRIILTPKGRESLGELGIYGRIILTWILMN